jgi:pyridoxamine 5'-phosphate oxidase-like protein
VSEPSPTPPRIPALYGVPTDASGAERLPWGWAVEQLERVRNYWVCTTRRDGRPHAAPVWAVWADGALWFSTSPASQKGVNLGRDPRVVVHLESGDDVVILEGDALAGPWPAAVFDEYEAKYGYRIDAESRASSLFVLRPRIVQTWTEHDFTRNATRWVFDDDR